MHFYCHRSVSGVRKTKHTSEQKGRVLPGLLQVSTHLPHPHLSSSILLNNYIILWVLPSGPHWLALLSLPSTHHILPILLPLHSPHPPHPPSSPLTHTSLPSSPPLTHTSFPSSLSTHHPPHHSLLSTHPHIFPRVIMDADGPQHEISSILLAIKKSFLGLSLKCTGEQNS